ncbi:chitinase [Dyella tabacisoli]|uniref:chitinase n=2 Tax=Dyella tabacisoli TaxID=2282381 RepID=A0A369UKH0_9GAMM|nr:chitinase [Dyella tabacisoli]
MVYKNHLYQALTSIWNTPPDYCPSCGWYQDQGGCSTGPNQPPTASITAPANGATFTAGANIVISAAAQDSDGTVTKVEFFNGTASLGVATASPYTVTWSNVQAGNYTLKAVATDNGGLTGASANVNITVSTSGDTTPPSVPQGLASTAQTSSSISLSWTASTDNPGGSGVAGYDIYRGGNLVGSSTATSYTDSGLSSNTSYSYTVRARDVAGNASAQSTAITAKTSADTTPPSVPQGLVSTAQTSSTISLSWAASTDNAGGSGVAGYDIYRGGSLVGSSTTTSYTDTGLSANTSYSYTVRARDNAGNASAQSSAITAKTSTGGTSSARVLGYFTQWGIYARNYQVKNIETSGSAAVLTHINYAFGNVRNNVCEVGVTQPADPNTGAGGDAYADYTKSYGSADSVDGTADVWNQPLRGNWNQLKQLKAKHPGLKVLISLGGWTWSRGFASAAQPANRQAFVASCIDAYIKGNLPATDSAGGAGAAAGVFDGIDIDWEYPAACGLSCGTSADTANFTALLAEFRRQLDAVRPGLLLTIAAGAGVDKIRVTQPSQYQSSVDFINVMTYDFHGAWETTTNFHSALYKPLGDPSTGDAAQYDTNDAIQAFLAAGMPASKINLGIGFYGRGWASVPNANNGLFQQSSTAAPGTYEAGIEDYKVLMNLGYPAFDDTTTGAHWIFNGSTFWSFDDPANIQRKMTYLKSQSLGGAFSWEFSGDDANGTLIKAMANGLK